MKRMSYALVGLFAGLVLQPPLAGAEILAMMNYESKPQDSLKALKTPVGQETRREGIAIVDVNPESSDFGRILMDIPLPPDLVAHHIFFNPDASKAYVTALGKPELRVIDLTRYPYRVKVVDVPDCKIGEDVVFSSANDAWYLTCMGSDAVIVGDAKTDEPMKTIKLPEPWPHGIAVHDGIDRVLVTSTVNAANMKEAGETITAIEASTGKVLSSYKLSGKPSPAGEAPVEILFAPRSDPPVAYVTNMFGATLWTAAWDPAKKDFAVRQVFDFAPHDAGVPLEMYFNDAGDRLYVTTAKPGQLHVLDIADPQEPKLLKSIATGEGAHHVAFTKDWRYAFVQNALLNLPGMSDGSITVIDIEKQEVVGSVDTLKNEGFNPNSIVLLPEWNHPAGH